MRVINLWPMWQLISVIPVLELSFAGAAPLSACLVNLRWHTDCEALGPDAVRNWAARQSVLMVRAKTLAFWIHIVAAVARLLDFDSLQKETVR